MRTVEQRFWARVRAPLVRAGAFLERIENIVGEGTPDVHGLADDVAFWMELKAVAAAPKRASSKLLGITHGLNNEQINWHLTYAQRGGNNWVLIGVGSREAILVHGKHALSINSASRDELISFCAAHVQSPSQWWIAHHALKGGR